MRKIFISWYDGQCHVSANEFFELLKKHNFEIECSPYNPHSGMYDERWKNWYKEGLPKAVNQAEIFIAVITPACDASTWMQQEFQEANSSFMKTGKPALYFIRFDSAEQPIKYQEYYLQNSIRLSSNPEEAVRTLSNPSI